MANLIFDQDRHRPVAGNSQRFDATSARVDGATQHPIGDDAVFQDDRRLFRLRASVQQDVIKPIIHGTVAASAAGRIPARMKPDGRVLSELVIDAQARDLRREVRRGADSLRIGTHVNNAGRRNLTKVKVQVLTLDRPMFA